MTERRHGGKLSPFRALSCSHLTLTECAYQATSAGPLRCRRFRFSVNKGTESRLFETNNQKLSAFYDTDQSSIDLVSVCAVTGAVWKAGKACRALVKQQVYPQRVPGELT